MNFFKRGILSIVRKPVRSLIIFLIVFVLGILMAGSVSIKNSLRNTQKSINQTVLPIATISVDWEQYERDMAKSGDEGERFPSVTKDTIQTIGELPYVKYYDYSISHYPELKDLKVYIPEDLANKASSEDRNLEEDYGKSVFIKGIQYHNISALEEGAISLKEGRVFTQQDIKDGKNYAVVGENFAKKNNLKIGSKFTTQDKIYKHDEDLKLSKGEVEDTRKPVETLEQEFEVIGTFTINKKEGQSNQKEQDKEFDEWRIIEQENTFFAPNPLVEKLMMESIKKDMEYNNYPIEDMMNPEEMYEPTFVLKENSMLKDFKQEASALLPQYNKITDATDSVTAITKPMEMINLIASIVLYASIGITVLILSLLVTLFLHDRRHEIGIYIAMGERKIRVMLQMLCEVVSVSLVAMTLALIIGNFLSRDFSKDILVDQTEKAQYEEDRYGYSTSSDFIGIETDIDSGEIANNYNVTLDFGTVLLFYAVGLGTIVISTAIPTMYISRLKPKEILM